MENISCCGGVLVTLSGGLVARKPLKGKLYSGNQTKDFGDIIDKPINFEGKFTSRSARRCHSSDSKENDALSGAVEITQQYIDNCMSGATQKPLVAFSGDSHSLAVFPISEVIASTSKFDVFSHSRDGCAFPPQGETSRQGCFEVQSSVAEIMFDEMSKRNSGSVFVATSYLNTYFPGGRNLDKYISASIKLSEKLKNIGASLILVAPLPKHPGLIMDFARVSGLDFHHDLDARKLKGSL